MKNKTIWAIIFFLLSGTCGAQNYQWAFNFTGDAGATVKPVAIAVDAAADVYTLGLFTGRVDLDAGEGNAMFDAGNRQDACILKTDPDGNFIWAKQITSAVAKSITVDKGNNIYVTGSFAGVLVYDGDSVLSRQGAEGGADGFILKINPQGNLSWLRTMQVRTNYVYSATNCYSSSLTTDRFGNVFATGAFSGRVDFDPGIDSFVVSSAMSTDLYTWRSVDIFVLKLDSNGSFVWVKSMGTSWNAEAGNTLQADYSGNIYIGGNFTDTLDFDPGPSVHQLISAGYLQAFILKLNPSGNFMWAKCFAGYSSNCSLLRIDKQGSVITAGDYQGTVDFNPGSGIFNQTAPSRSFYITKLDSLGNFTWAKSIGASLITTHASAMITDDLDNILLGGFYTDNYYGPLDFDPGPGVFNQKGALNNDLFILKLNASGNFVWVKAMAGNQNEAAVSIGCDAIGNIYTTGYFLGSLDFDPGAGTRNLNGALSANTFVLKLGSCQLSILSQPKNALVIMGGNTRFIINTTTAGTSYRWQLNTGSGFGNLADTGHYSGAANDTLTFNGVAISNNNNQYRCLLNNGNCMVTSNTAYLSVDCDFLISREPANQFVHEDSLCSFSVSVSDTGMRYQWQQNTGAGFVDLKDSGIFSGVTSDTLRINPVSFALNGRHFRCLVIRNGCTRETRAATLLVKCNFTLNRQPVNQQILVNTSASFIARSIDAADTYQWQENRGFGFINMIDTLPYSGSADDTLSINPVKQLLGNFGYRCVVTHNGCQLASDSVAIKVQCAFSITKQPVDQFTRKDSITVFTVLSSDPAVRYQWQVGSEKEGKFYDANDSIHTHTFASYQFGNFSSSIRWVRCILSDSFCAVTSDAVYVTLCTNSFTVQPVSQFVSLGSSPQFSVTSPEFLKSFQWQIKGDSGFIDLKNSGSYSGVTTAVLTVNHVSASQNHSVFRCAYLAGGCTLYSKLALLTIDVGQGIIANQEITQQILLYPNPSHDLVSIEVQPYTSELKYCLLDISGKIVMQGSFTKAVTSIDVSVLQPGFYFLQTTDSNQKTHKLIKY